MQFIVNDQRIAVENFQIGKIYTIKFATSYLTAACIGVGADFVAFQRTQPEYIFILSMGTAADVVSIDLSVIVDTVSGQPPLSFISDGSDILHWTMYGNTVQNGTPEPDSPIYPDGVGTIDDTLYRIPIICGEQTTNVYLDSVQTTRYIRKMVLTGDENYTLQSINAYGVANFYMYISTTKRYGICSHLKQQTSNIGSTQDEGFLVAAASGNRITFYIRIFATTAATKEDLQAYIAGQYTNGTPVTIWYVTDEPEISIINEPLHKIGNYADSISDVAAIPTVSGINTLSVDTVIQPSNMIIQSQI